MRIVTMRVLGGLLVGVLALAPLTTAYAQATLDPAVLATVQGAVGEVGRVAEPATMAPLPSVAELAPVLAPTPVPAPEDTIVVEPTPEPVDEPTPVPPDVLQPPGGPIAHFDPATAESYSSGAVTLYAPPEWEVEDYGSDGEASLYVSVPGNSDILIAVQDGGADFPGLAGLVLFPSLADLLVAELGENGTVEVADVTTTAQGLPSARVIFQGDMDGEAGGGAFYVIAAGDTAYLFLAFAPLDVWDDMRPDIEAIAESIEIDESTINIVTADSDDFYYVDDAGTVEVYVPNGWHAAGSPLEDLPVIVTDADYSYALMMATDKQFAPNMGPDVEALLATPPDEYTPDILEAITTALMDEMTSGGDFTLDTTQTQQFDNGDGVTLRFVGEGELDTDVTIPVVVYFNQSSDGISVALVMGNVDALLADEDTALNVVQSLLSLE